MTKDLPAGCRRAPQGACGGGCGCRCTINNGIVYAMKTTIDSAGRIVVPKVLRQVLDLKPGQTLEIRAGDGRLEIEIAATPMTLRRRGKSVVAVPETALPTLTAAEVRDTLERVRR